MDVLTDFIVGIISQFICISDNHTVHLKFTKCYMSIIAEKKTEEKRVVYIRVNEIGAQGDCKSLKPEDAQ